MNDKENQSLNKWIKVLSFIVAISIAGNLILYMKNSDLFPKKKELVERNAKLNRQLAASKNEINKYKGISKRIDAVVEDANNKLDNKEQQIMALIREKRAKEKENQAILLQLDSLQNKYLGVIDSLLVEREQRKVINQKIEGLQGVIAELNIKLGIAEMMIGDNLKAAPFRIGYNAKRQPTAMVKRTDEIEVCIDILENRLTKPGKQQIYIVITSPNAKVLIDQLDGDVEFLHADYKTQARCSKIEEVDYLGKKIHLCSTIKPVQISGTGLYLVEVFSDNNKLAMSSFTLR